MPESNQQELISIETTRFGKISVPFDKVITLPHGMVGFPAYRRYALLRHREDSPFYWLQSMDRPELAFAVVSPLIFDRQYQVTLGNTETMLLQVQNAKDIQLWVVVTIPRGRPDHMTANLKAPVVINLNTNLGAQIIMDDPNYDVRQALPS